MCRPRALGKVTNAHSGVVRKAGVHEYVDCAKAIRLSYIENSMRPSEPKKRGTTLDWA